MKRLIVLAALVIVPAASADVGLRLDTTTVSVGQFLRGWGTGGMPVYLVPERSALRHPRKTQMRPRAPYVYLGTPRPPGGDFGLRVPDVRPGRYQVVLWCRPCGNSLILAGATMYGQVVNVRPRGDVVRLVRLAPKRIAHCRRSALLAPVCPRLVPRVGAPYLSHLATHLTGPRPLDVFNLERGGEWPAHPERNRPPRMGHLVLAAGNVRGLAPVWTQGVRRARLRDELMRERRPFLLRFGTVRWAGRKGWLELAPPYLRGGMLGNHLIFRWRAHGREYLVSLHAWEPLTEAADTLRAIVASTP